MTVTADSIVEHFDPFKNILRGVLPCSMASMMHKFRFQRMEEAFHHGIVPAIPASTHARRQAVARKPLVVGGGGGGILRPTV